MEKIIDLSSSICHPHACEDNDLELLALKNGTALNGLLFAFPMHSLERGRLRSF